MSQTFCFVQGVTDGDGGARTLNLHLVVKVYADANNGSRTKVHFLGGATETLGISAGALTMDDGMVPVTTTGGLTVYINFNNVKGYWTDATNQTRVVFRDDSYEYVRQSPATISALLGP